MHSALYHGTVAHARSRPINHTFRYPVTMAYLDLAELPELLRSVKLLGSRWRPFVFREADHRFGETSSLEAEIRDTVERAMGIRPAGPIRLLTMLRTWGLYFSPLNLYYCFDADGERLTAIVAEVSNTPWLEKHRYVLRVKPNNSLQFVHAKDFHVSPFMPMELEYAWDCSLPGESLGVQISLQQGGGKFFTASMSLERRPLRDKTLAYSLVMYPVATARVVTAIYWQALKLWWKACPFYSHPKKLSATHGGTPLV